MQEIYNGLRHFYTPSLLPKNTLFQVERKKRVTDSVLISLIYKLASKPVTSTDNNKLSYKKKKRIKVILSVAHTRK